jgi:acyl-CoA thioesterase-1
MVDVNYVDNFILPRKAAAGLSAALSFRAGCWMTGVLCAGLLMSGCKSAADKVETSPARPITESTPMPATPPITADPPDTRPVIACFGDSLTAGYGTEPGESYPDDLQKILNQQGYNYRVANDGVSGETTKDGVERVERIAAKRPKIVVLEFGGNDGLRGLPLEQTQANLATMIETLQKSGAEVALAGISLPQEYGPDYIAKINAIYPALAKRYHVRLLPFLLKDVYGVPGDMQEDGHHATAKGNVQVAKNVEDLIRPLMKK